MCRTCGALNRIMMADVPSPSGLGYVLARLRRWGFVAMDLSRYVEACDSAPEARKTVAQCASTGYPAR
jgi:hypothetical protein